MSIKISHRVEMIEKSLRVTLPKEYAKFIEEIGVYKGEYFDVYGYDEGIEDIEAYPCVIGMTHSYAKDNPLIEPQDIMIHFDEYLNSVVALDCRNGGIYNIDFEERKEIAKNFEEWFEWLKDMERKAMEE